MPLFTAKVDLSQAKRLLKAAEKQIRFAEVLALNRTAFSILKAERANLASTFKHPRPFTVNNNFVIKATNEKPVATIGIKPRSAVYLSPYEFGGEHYLPNRPDLGRVLLVPVYMKTDAYGQLPSGAALAKVLARPDVFVGEVYGVNGIWLRPPRGKRGDGNRGTKGKLKIAPGSEGHTGLTLLAEIKQNRAVPEHLNFVKTGRELFEKLYPDAFERAFAHAIATARP